MAPSESDVAMADVTVDELDDEAFSPELLAAFAQVKAARDEGIKVAEEAKRAAADHLSTLLKRRRRK
eukprot:6523507-Karenia_brevis.AAC.1